MTTEKKSTPIFQSLTALAARGNTLTYNILLLDKELCVQITGNSGGGEFDNKKALRAANSNGLFEITN
jgi:hypothetical protein